ncbi:MAG: hypothetical protein DI539_28225 [Flavobacterium psychrophilum]|nr:acyltransferase [Chitinophagaceae bacterium]PZR01778.1 MAG: hypothetical protein DI539_28225 [Flavobacterium psychrophilum]
MLRKLINTYISKIKKEPYNIDASIPTSYLYGFVFSRVIMLLRGKIRFIGRRQTPFVGSSVTLKAKSLFKMGYGVTIGNGCYIDALSVEGIQFGNNVSIGPRTKIECTGSIRTLGKGLTVEDNVGLGSDNFYGCAGGISIGQDTIIGNFVSFHAENHRFSDRNIPIRLQGVTHEGIKIGQNCWIGAKVTILDGVIIEDGCIIAAGALVKAGVYKKEGIYGGVPAKLIKHRFSE